MSISDQAAATSRISTETLIIQYLGSNIATSIVEAFKDTWEDEITLLYKSQNKLRGRMYMNCNA